MATREVPEPGQKARLKRTRTGCLKCRVRRRKCDEKKPSCQRCVDGGFVCQYGTKLSFLEKNTITASGPSKSARQSYSTLRFVDTHPAASQTASPISPSAEPPASNVSETERGLGHQPSPSHSPTSPQLPTPRSDTTTGAHLKDLQNPGGAYAVDTSPSNGAYETALDVLTSLGSVNSGGASATPLPPGYGPSPHEDSTPYAHGDLRSHSLGVPEEFSTCSLLPQDPSIQLLRHYRYNLAPWVSGFSRYSHLDIDDPTQTFGLEIPRFALSSVPVLESLLSLSLASLDRYADADLKAVQHEARETSLIESLVIVTLAAVRSLTLASPPDWQSPFATSGIQPLDAALRHNGHTGIRMAVARMFLRLDVSVGLMNNRPVSIPSILLYGISSPELPEIPIDALRYNWDPLVLCSLALNYCYGDEMHQSAGSFDVGMGTTDRWKMLTETLVLWYNNRPDALKPILEVAHNDQLFPLILFSSGTAVFANQLFHTAMLLLLQHRPRTFLSSGHSRPVAMSPLWHAQRVCGISLSNDSRKSWDFCLVGSLYIGARCMTYDLQQHALISGINRISCMTGWNLRPLEARLLDAWQQG
ncbi:hypothetical protein GMORB2_1330 [Geosmithia morbida]|uniref:Zn(2)-C6 fungal-type domain-containing protein n=1 Tax=Geosmithia morbida TaxID=1094350 RepID=A0A9P4Z286_9HYPO|nr:uncharacterized protein GMORB2_1330 [Geosmithia morbida]KAF4126084.1 hypothetical protein GMORB2_1330 [Geosmithia morbida]